PPASSMPAARATSPTHVAPSPRRPSCRIRPGRTLCPLPPETASSPVFPLATPYRDGLATESACDAHRQVRFVFDPWRQIALPANLQMFSADANEIYRPALQTSPRPGDWRGRPQLCLRWEIQV